MNPFQNKLIKISAIEPGDKLWTLKDESGTKYKMWLKKKDGFFTQAYEQWQVMNLNVGMTVNISYTEEPKEYKGKPYTERTLTGFREATGCPEPRSEPQTPTPATKPSQDFKFQRKEEIIESREDYGRRLALHGMVNGMLSSGATIEQVHAQLTDLVELEDHINEVLAGKIDLEVNDIPFSDDEIPMENLPR